VRCAAEDDEPEVPAAPPRRLPLGDLVALQWGEYGSLIPFLLAPLLLLSGTRPKDPIALYLVLFALPFAAVLVPPVYRALVAVVAEVRLVRLLPLSPALAALAVYGWNVRALNGPAPWARRLVAVLVLASSVAVLVPSVRAAWRWYVRVYPSTIPVETSDHAYLSVGSLLRLGTESWPPVLASNRRMALKLAAIARRPVAFEEEGRRLWATRTDVLADEDKRPIQWAFTVKDGGAADPGGTVCAEELYRDDLILCATEPGRSRWSYPGRGTAAGAR
jgi:hypothetical protein